MFRFFILELHENLIDLTKKNKINILIKWFGNEHYDIIE